MKKILWLLALLPSVSFAGLFSSGGSPDYSNNAGNMFYCASTGTVTTQAGVSLSSPTISLYNPWNSGKNLTVLDVGINVMASPSASAQFTLAYTTGTIAISTNTGAAGVVIPALIAKSTSSVTLAGGNSGVCWLKGILPSLPVNFRFLGGTTGASAIGGAVFTDNTNGKVVIPPGAMISLQSSSAANLQAHILWREDNL